MTTTQRVIDYLKSTDLYKARIDEAATLVCMSRSTLGRRLADEGTTFQRLRNNERKRRCLQALDDDPLTSCIRLAELCGYSCHTVFCRAFTGWMGISLREYKA